MVNTPYASSEGVMFSILVVNTAWPSQNNDDDDDSCVILFFFFFFHVYLDALDLSCGTWDFFLGNVYSLVVAGGLRS